MIISCRSCDEDMEFCDVIDGVTIFRCNNCCYEVEIKREESNMDISGAIKTYVKPEEISNTPTSPTTVVIRDSGIETEYEGRKGYVFTISLPNGDKKSIRFNKTSLSKIVKFYGTETSAWVGKEVKLFTMPSNVNGTIRQVIYVA